MESMPETVLQGAERPAREISPEPFRTTLARHGLQLVRRETTTLQVNVGLLCNQTCKHCHLEAGPHRNELMERETAAQVVAFARRNTLACVDITGGAPELYPHLEELIRELAPCAGRLIVRSNLVVLAEGDTEGLIAVFKHHGVDLIGSLPAPDAGRTEGQRGEGVFGKSIQALRALNRAGYGMPGSGLRLDLVSNPTGAFLPPPQEATEGRFRRVLEGRHGVSFHQLLTFANVPLGRFRAWLKASGNLERYLDRLAAAFNPCALDGVMCRSLISVAWDGQVYDCDFNLARGLPLGGERKHITQLLAPPPPGTPIAVADHCYTCTAGAGFT